MNRLLKLTGDLSFFGTILLYFYLFFTYQNYFYFHAFHLLLLTGGAFIILIILAIILSKPKTDYSIKCADQIDNKTEMRELTNE